MILILDNYDSFVFNIVRYVEELGFPAEVVRNDTIGVDDILAAGATGLILSPGPCTPAEAGISTGAVRRLSGKIPILGICLGHQCIGAAFGAPVVPASEPLHGRASLVTHDGSGLFAALPQRFRAGRYHSLAVVCDGHAPELAACAWTDDGEVMALRHRAHPTFGVQFHPESVLTEHGYGLLAAFLDLTTKRRRSASALMSQPAGPTLSPGRQDRSGGQMTMLLASVTGPGEAETAVAGGADIIDLKDPEAGALGALPVAVVRQAVAAIAGRRPSSAVAGDLPMQAETVVRAVAALAETGVDYVKVGLFPDGRRREAIAALAELARRTKLIGVIFADREEDSRALLDDLAAAGFAGAMLDTADKEGGRLTTIVPPAGLAGFVLAARAKGLLVGLAGKLEAPDVPRLLPLAADFLGFRGALCAAHDRRAGLDPEALARIRRAIPRTRPGNANVDYRLLSARGYHPDRPPAEERRERVFVNDLVLPVRIGAYSHERAHPQRVRFSVAVDVDRQGDAAAEIGDVFSYDLITDAIRALVAEAHFDFVETLAERIGANLLSHSEARRATVKVEKLDVGPGAVGVEIVMERPDRASVRNPVLAMLESVRKPGA
jgi:dihydroneopterin aldolase